MAPSVVGILQSRMTSTRLPGKALVDISGKPLTRWILERARRCRTLRDVVLACPAEREDDELARVFAGEFRVYRGSLQDVLDRYWNAARQSLADVVVRLVGDNPMLDPDVMDAAVEKFLESGADYGSTADCPLGIGAEVFTMDAINRAHREAVEPYQREHVTPYFYEQPGRFRTAPLNVQPHLHGLTKDRVRLTVDTAEDLELARDIYARLLPRSPEFGLRQIAELFSTDPQIFSKNMHIRQKSFKEAEKPR